MNRNLGYEPFESEMRLVEEVENRCESLMGDDPVDYKTINLSHPLIRSEQFLVEEYNGSETPIITKVTGQIWSDAIQEILDQHKNVYIPHLKTPIYLDKPIVMKSSYRLKVHPETEIRLKPHTNTCMLRNESIISGAQQPVDELDTPRDDHIVVEGGIWTTLANGKRGGNGNVRGHADDQQSVPGIHGVLSFHNTRLLTIRNVSIKESTYFGIHVGNSEAVVIENIRYLNHHCDGVHLDGPVTYGIIRNISGKTGDDMVALNAWDWEEYSVTFGPIRKIVVENVVGPAGHVWSEIRMLPGIKRFTSGRQLACTISEILFRNIRQIHTFKMYDQPNIDQTKLYDRSPSIGQMDHIYFSDITFDIFDPGEYYCNHDAALEICSNVGHLYVNAINYRNVKPDSPLYKHNRLVAVGPMSFQIGGKFEIFRPEFSCSVERLIVKNIKLAEGCSMEQMLYERNQQSGGEGKIKDWILVG